MCNHCSNDPRDAIGEADRALFGLRLLLNQLPPNADISAVGIGSIVGLINERLEDAAVKIQNYVPREYPIASV